MPNISWSPEKLKAAPRPKFHREDATANEYVFSYSGGLICQGPLCEIATAIKGNNIIVRPLERLARPCRRPNPQIEFETVSRFFSYGGDYPPFQIAAHPEIKSGPSAAIKTWIGPSPYIDRDDLPKDTLRLIVLGPRSGDLAEQIDRYLIHPFWNWIRHLTDQWWAGRSAEATSGPLHLVIPSAQKRLVGAPIPVTSVISHSKRARKATDEIWRAAWEKAVEGILPPSPDMLLTDGTYLLASKEWRSAILTLMCSIECARDEMLTRHGFRLSRFSTSKTDILRHCRIDAEKAFSRHLENESGELFEFLVSLWATRGELGHGKPLRFRTSEGWIDVRDVNATNFCANVRKVIEWLRSV